MNDKKSTQVLLWILGVLSVSGAGIIFLITIVRTVLGPGTPYAFSFSESFESFSRLYNLYTWFLLFAVCILVVQSFRIYKRGEFRKARMIAVTPLVLFLLYAFFSMSFIDKFSSEEHRVITEKNAAINKKYYAGILKTPIYREPGGDYDCYDGSFIRATQGIFENFSLPGSHGEVRLITQMIDSQTNNTIHDVKFIGNFERKRVPSTKNIYELLFTPVMSRTIESGSREEKALLDHITRCQNNGIGFLETYILQPTVFTDSAL